MDIPTHTHRALLMVGMISIKPPQSSFSTRFAPSEYNEHTVNAVKDKAANLNHFSFLLLKEQIKLKPVKMIAEIPKNSHIYCLLKFSYPVPL